MFRVLGLGQQLLIIRCDFICCFVKGRALRVLLGFAWLMFRGDAGLRAVECKL